MVTRPPIDPIRIPQNKTFVPNYFNKGVLDFDEQGLDENVIIGTWYLHKSEAINFFDDIEFMFYNGALTRYLYKFNEHTS